MYGKHFESMYTGSMMGAGALKFAVWGYVISHVHSRTNTVELNPKLIAVVLGETEADVISTIDFFCSPDPHSRSKEHGGARLLRCGEFLYEVVNAKKYRMIASDDDRQTYVREYMREYRSKQDVNTCKQSKDKQKKKYKHKHKQKQKQEEEELPLNAASSLSEVFDAWNLAADNNALPKCLVLSDSRRRTLEVRLREPFFRNHWKEALAKMLLSDFCKGQNERGWKATFEFFISPNAVPKIMEGKYDKRNGNGNAALPGAASIAEWKERKRLEAQEEAKEEALL